MSEPIPPPANRLALEKSPYLLQHARNPVDWYPWGGEAFARARALDRPIFLSIGYATCHWCHVMERESFEDAEVASLLNAGFVAVKVDREERPDIDRIYMTAMQALGLGGGWPLTVFLTPDLAPFFGGTYFPREGRPGRPGMLELLPALSGAWRERRDELVHQGARVLEALDSLAQARGEPASGAALAAGCLEALGRAHDPRHGGFGDAPKFPSPGNLAFLLAHWAQAPEDPARAPALAMVRGQLDAMVAGGIHDQVGGGFHRYSTDARWLVPHFEKMLYDQAQIADVLVDAFHATGGARYAAAARATFAYVRRDLTLPGGAFASAEDADSEGEEGRFYVWTPSQLAGALDDADARLAAHHWGVTPQGNFEHGASVLHEAHALERSAHALGLDADEARRRLARVRARLLEARSARPRPLRDDKVIAAWNGMMIAACAHGAQVLGEPALGEMARAAAAFAWERLRDPATGALHRRWREGEAAGAGQLDDHAHMARAMLALWDLDADPLWLERAAALAGVMLARFRDAEDGGFFESPEGDPSVRLRMKDGFDGAETAGNSIAAQVLLRLARLLERDDLRAACARSLDYHARRLAGGAAAMPALLVAMERWAAPHRQVVVTGPAGAGRDELLAEARRRFRPQDEVVAVYDEFRGALARLAPFAAGLPAAGGRATAYVCVDHACRLPVTDAPALAELLDGSAPSPARGEKA